MSCAFCNLSALSRAALQLLRLALRPSPRPGLFSRPFRPLQTPFPAFRKRRNFLRKGQIRLCPTRKSGAFIEKDPYIVCFHTVHESHFLKVTRTESNSVSCRISLRRDSFGEPCANYSLNLQYRQFARFPIQFVVLLYHIFRKSQVFFVNFLQNFVPCEKARRFHLKNFLLFPPSARPISSLQTPNTGFPLRRNFFTVYAVPPVSFRQQAISASAFSAI